MPPTMHEQGARDLLQGVLGYPARVKRRRDCTGTVQLQGEQNHLVPEGRYPLQGLTQGCYKVDITEK